MQLSRTGKKWISVIVAIRPVFPDPVTYTDLDMSMKAEITVTIKISLCARVYRLELRTCGPKTNYLTI